MIDEFRTTIGNENLVFTLIVDYFFYLAESTGFEPLACFRSSLLTIKPVFEAKFSTRAATSSQ